MSAIQCSRSSPRFSRTSISLLPSSISRRSVRSFASIGTRASARTRRHQDARCRTLCCSREGKRISRLGILFAHRTRRALCWCGNLYARRGSTQEDPRAMLQRMANDS
ncbi:MAG: hypothetical protein MZV64_35625 [Ignavibacteriales bacterium]|nr:hypothetical protein [Ignavibacteriales bacterium]